MDDGASPKLHYAERNNWFSDFLKKLNRRNPDKITEQEIISIVNEGHETGVLQDSEVEMIQNIFEFTDKEAKDIMTHRKHICALDGTKTLAQVLDLVLAEPYIWMVLTISSGYYISRKSWLSAAARNIWTGRLRILKDCFLRANLFRKHAKSVTFFRKCS